MNEVLLGDYVKVTSGFAFKSKMFNEENKGLPLIRIRDVGKNEPKTYFDGEYSAVYIVTKGDLLISMDGEFKIAEWRGANALLNQRVCKIESISNKLDSKYLLHLLPKKLKQIEDTTSFVTVKHLSVKEINNIVFPLPTIMEQQKIVTILDNVQSLIDKRKQQIELLDQLVQSLFLEMFGVPVINTKRFPVHKLSDFSIHVSSGSTPKGGQKSYKKEGISFIRSQNVLMNKLSFDDIAFIDIETHNNMNRSKVLYWDVLLNITGASIGRVVVFDKEMEANVNQHVCIIRLNGNLNPYYLTYYLGHNAFQNYIRSLNSGATREALNYTQIKNFDIPYPPIELQNSFEQKIKIIDKNRELLKRSLVEMENLFNSLMQRAFKGELFKEKVV